MNAKINSATNSKQFTEIVISGFHIFLRIENLSAPGISGLKKFLF